MNEKLEEIRQVVCELKGEDTVMTKGQILDEAVIHLGKLREENQKLKEEIIEIKERDAKKLRLNPTPIRRIGSKEA
jgi:hypothetical protein